MNNAANYQVKLALATAGATRLLMLINRRSLRPPRAFSADR